VAAVRADEIGADARPPFLSTSPRANQLRSSLWLYYYHAAIWLIFSAPGDVEPCLARVLGRRYVSLQLPRAARPEFFETER
jgi:hypothetical protein